MLRCVYTKRPSLPYMIGGPMLETFALSCYSKEEEDGDDDDDEIRYFTTSRRCFLLGSA